MQKFLLWMRHGLGDQFSLQIVIRHLRHYYDDAHITVECPAPYMPCYFGLADEVKTIGTNYAHSKWNYDRPHYLQMGPAKKLYEGCPSTKANRCIVEEFNLIPKAELFYYSIQRTSEGKAAARHFRKLLRRPYALIHSVGVSRGELKNLTDHECETILEQLRSFNAIPVWLDWDKSCPFVDDRNVLRLPDYFKHPQRLASAIDRADLFIGVDSGPAHLAGATDTHTIVLWKQFTPFHNYDLADNVVHLIGNDSIRAIANIDEELEAESSPLDYCLMNYSLFPYPGTLAQGIEDYFDTVKCKDPSFIMNEGSCLHSANDSD